MPNHFHAIVSSDIPSQLPSIIRDIKHFTSIALRSCLHADNARYLYSLLDPETDQRSAQSRSRRLWQPGYHGVAIYSQPFFRSKLDYLHENPVRKGFVDRAEHWRCSSARDYILNERGPIAIDLLEI
jgi:REP element-mobilizing transposase RayT